MSESPEPPNATDGPATVARLIALLDIETLDIDLFRGRSYESGSPRVYGGQVVAQALTAASRTVRPERLAHSLHAYFLRPGDPQAPIIYRVERDRDGQSFATRRVIAVQHGRPIFNLAASFQVAESGLDHGSAMPKVADADGLISQAELYARHAAGLTDPQRAFLAAREWPIEFRPVDQQNPFKPKKAKAFAYNWFRAAAPVPDDPTLARCLLAYASDLTLLGTSLLPHGLHWFDPALQSASIDHSLWFHATPDLNDWLLYCQDSPRAAAGRGLNRGLIHARDGTIVASAVQEGLIRYRG